MVGLPHAAVEENQRGTNTCGQTCTGDKRKRKTYVGINLSRLSKKDKLVRKNV